MSKALLVAGLAFVTVSCTTSPSPSGAPRSGSVAEATDVVSAINAKTRDMIETKSGLRYEIIRVGDGARPTLQDTVHVLYTMRVLGSDEIISRSSGGNVPDHLILNLTIDGWQEGLQLMREGSVFRFYMPPHLAYGEDGAGAVGPNQTLIFDIALVKVEGPRDLR